MDENREGPQRHPTLYMPTGDFVISAKSDDAAQLFRVHSAILALHSPVFAGMFALPVQQENMEKYDGAPLVHLPDKAKDVESLLEVLYSPG